MGVAVRLYPLFFLFYSSEYLVIINILFIFVND
nr:MAG TPA: hypothetical protein [Caudoviricetes sp.]